MVLIILLSYNMNKFVSKNRPPIYASITNSIMSEPAAPDVSHNFHNLIRFFCVKIAKSYTWFLMNADKFYRFLFIHDQLSDNYPTHMDSIIENQHFGLTPFSPPDLNATLSNKKVWSRFTYLY